MLKAPYVVMILAAGLVVSPVAAQAQSDDIPLGDLARTLRKNQPPPRAIIDNDNLSAVMEQGQDKLWDSRVRVNDAAMEVINVSSPDVTCALSFSGQKDALDERSQPQNLPDDIIGLLSGPASIAGDRLQLTIHNGSNWEVREITVGLTLVHRPFDPLIQFDGGRLIPAVVNNAPAEKTSDTTVLYHLKGAAAPSSTSLFQAPLNISMVPDQEWHWAIIRAKGIPPAAPSEAESGTASQVPKPTNSQ